MFVVHHGCFHYTYIVTCLFSIIMKQIGWKSSQSDQSYLLWNWILLPITEWLLRFLQSNGSPKTRKRHRRRSMHVVGYYGYGVRHSSTEKGFSRIVWAKRLTLVLLFISQFSQMFCSLQMSNAYKKSDKYMKRWIFLIYSKGTGMTVMRVFVLKFRWQMRIYQEIYCSIRWIWQSVTIVNSFSTLCFNFICTKWREEIPYLKNWKFTCNNSAFEIIPETIFVFYIWRSLSYFIFLIFRWRMKEGEYTESKINRRKFINQANNNWVDLFILPINWINRTTVNKYSNSINGVKATN